MDGTGWLFILLLFLRCSRLNNSPCIDLYLVFCSISFTGFLFLDVFLWVIYVILKIILNEILFLNH